MQASAILCAVAAAFGQVEQVRQKPGGLYLKLGGMLVLQDDSDLQSVGGVPLNATLEFDTGFGIETGVGYTFSSQESRFAATLEMEYAYRAADLNTLTAPGLSLAANGTNESHALMFNALGSVDIVGGFGLYGGGGVGVAMTRSDLVLDLGGGMVLTFPRDDAFTFTWQVMGGAQMALGRHVMLFGGVKYFDAGDVIFDTFGGTNRSLAFEAGLRVYF